MSWLDTDMAMAHSDMVKYLDECKSIKAKTKFMDAHYERLGTGSSRRVWNIGKGRVLKLAINDKGLDQNRVEAAIHLRSLKGFAKTYDESRDYRWIIQEKADTVKSNDFKKAFGAKMLDVFAVIEHQGMRCNRLGKVMPLDEHLEKLADHPVLSDICDAMADLELCDGDLVRKCSWGKIGDRVVLRDYGLSREVYNSWYKPIRKADGRYVRGERNK